MNYAEASSAKGNFQQTLIRRELEDFNEYRRETGGSRIMIFYNKR